MKDITIKIVGKRYNGETEEAEGELEFVSDGTMYQRGGALYYLYEESEFSGMPGCKTSLKVTDSRVRMKRIGDEGFGAELVFEKGKRFISRYATPYGPIDMEVLTNRVDTDLDEDGFGRILLDYSVCMEGLGEGRNQVDIEIMQ